MMINKKKISIIICLIWGLLYVIPFYNALSVKERVIYSQHYFVYILILLIFGLIYPYIFFKLEKKYDKDHLFRWGKIVSVTIGLILFLISLFFNYKETTILFLIYPLISVYRFYKKDKIINSLIIEQGIRTFLIFIMSFRKMNVLNNSLYITFLSSLLVLIYLLSIKKVNKQSLGEDKEKIKKDFKKEALFDLKNLFYLSGGFLLNLFILSKKEKEFLSSSMCWSLKIIIFLSLLFIIFRKEKETMRENIYDLEYLLVPICVLISLLVPFLVKGLYEAREDIIISLRLLLLLLPLLFSIIYLYLGKQKKFSKYLGIGFLTKLFLTLPFLYTFETFGFKAYGGLFASSFLGFLTTLILIMIYYVKHNILKGEELFKKTFNLLFYVLVIVFVLFVILSFLSLEGDRFKSLVYFVLFFSLGLFLFKIMRKCYDKN